MSESFNYTETTVHTIKSCIDCPFHKIVADPDPYDSFNMDDEAVICTKSIKEPQTIGLGNYRCGDPVITCACRPYQVRVETTPPPSWCPIKPSTPVEVEKTDSENKKEKFEVPQSIKDFILTL